MKSLTIAASNLRRMFRQPATIFFVFIFPMLLILLLGATFGGAFTPRIGVVAKDPGPLGRELISALEATEDLEAERYEARASMLTDVERGRVQGGLILPPGFDERLRTGEELTLEYLVRPDQLGQQLRITVESAVREEGVLLRAARFAAEQGVPFQEALTAASQVAPAVESIEVPVTTAGETIFPEEAGTFDAGASSQLILFMFFTSLTGASALIESRRLGITRRMLSTPTSSGSVLLGETLGRFGIALVQGVFIMVGSLLLFGVSWGDPLGAVALLVVFALVGTGAGMLVGAALGNEQQAISVSLLVGLGMAALGGAMVPLEVFSDTMQTVAHVTPHAWALDGFADLIRRDEGLVSILPEVGVLLAYAALLLSVATWRLRRSITA